MKLNKINAERREYYENAMRNGAIGEAQMSRGDITPEDFALYRRYLWGRNVFGAVLLLLVWMATR